MKFASVEQAIKFSFNIMDRAEYAKSDPMRVRGTSAEDLSPMDLHAQAAMIHSMLWKLHPAERDAVLAMYARGRSRSEAIRGLAEYLLPALRSELGVRELQIVVLHWSTKRPSIRKIAEETGVSYRRVCSWRTAVLRAWMPLQVRAIEGLHQKMFGPGGFELEQ
jgi:hypothetical protein